MIRKAFVMHVNPDQHEEYEKRHNPIWSELAETLKNHGGSNYSIFLDSARNLLFGYVEIESEAKWDEIANTEICQKWWAYMSSVMPSNPDNSPISTNLKQVFFLE